MTLKSGLWVIQCHWKWHAPFDRLHTNSYWLSITVALSCIISDLSEILVENHMVWCGKAIEWCAWLPDGEKKFNIFSRSTIPACD